MSKIHDAIRSRNMGLLIKAIESGEQLVFDDPEWGQKIHALNVCIYSKGLNDDSYFTNVEAARILLTHPLTRDETDLNSDESIAMFSAAASDSVGLLNLFYSFGGNINIKRTQDEEKSPYISSCLRGATPLYRALVANARKTAKRLVELGVDTSYVKELIIMRSEKLRVKSNEDGIKASYAVHIEKEHNRFSRYLKILEDTKCKVYC